jgi:hypothetical protein
VVRRAHFDAQRLTARPGVHPRSEGSEGLGQHHMGPSMEDARHLCVPFHGHGRHRPLRTHLQEPDSHLHHQGADAVPGKPVVQVLRHPRGKQFVPELHFDGGAGLVVGVRLDGRSGFPGRLAVREIVHHGN